MVLNKVKGNMYSFCTHTWNVIKGKCSHDCSYCYMKRFPQNPIRLDEKEFKTDLGEGNFIFVGSSTDMFADDIPRGWIERVIEHCNQYPKNTYLFQSKNPGRFKDFELHYPKNSIFGTTAESNLAWKYSKAPNIHQRLVCLSGVKGRKMVTIEPIMDFDLDMFVTLLRGVKPEFVNIGADSQGHNLPEPSWDKIQSLIKELEKFTKVNLKDNLNRLKKPSCNHQNMNK